MKCLIGILNKEVHTRWSILTVPPDLHYQNEKNCLAKEELFYVENSLKNSSCCLQLVFYFGIEDREEKFKTSQELRKLPVTNYLESQV